MLKNLVLRFLLSLATSNTLMTCMLNINQELCLLLTNTHIEGSLYYNRYHYVGLIIDNFFDDIFRFKLHYKKSCKS